jgi:hypothetical protein
MLYKHKYFIAFSVIICLMIFAGPALAADLTSLDIKSTTFVPGEEGRYTLVFTADAQLNLSVADYIYVDFPEGFSLVQNPYDSEDPGCTLANIQYKNSSSEKYWSIVRGDVSVQDENRFVIEPLTLGSVVNPEREIFLVIPGVINKPTPGPETVLLSVVIEGTSYTGSAQIILGEPPSLAPEGLSVEAIASTRVEAVWEAVYDATRYRLLYSNAPDGQFIQAYDFGKEPAPGQEGNLTDTECIYSGNGNGGLDAGRKYYFKVQAGNDFGFGPFSDTVAVTMPVIGLDRFTTNITMTSPIKVFLDQDVKITDPDRIQVYEESNGAPVLKSTLDANGDRVIITAPLETGKRYQVVFYDQALESDETDGVYNRLFGWSFTALQQNPQR